MAKWQNGKIVYRYYSSHSNFKPSNTHSQCVLPNSNPQATCKQENSQGVRAKTHNESVYFC